MAYTPGIPLQLLMPSSLVRDRYVLADGELQGAVEELVKDLQSIEALLFSLHRLSVPDRMRSLKVKMPDVVSASVMLEKASWLAATRCY